jgi:PTS system ascorbate-specific IIA component
MPIDILIIAHAPLASALRSCVLHVFPEVAANLRAIDVAPDEAPEATQQRVQACLQASDTNSVLVLTDVLGATPCNIARKIADHQQCKLVAGVNLPMLLRTVNYRHESMDALVARALAGGKQCIVEVAPVTSLIQPA